MNEAPHVERADRLTHIRKPHRYNKGAPFILGYEAKVEASFLKHQRGNTMRTATRFLSLLGASLLTLSMTASHAHAGGKIVSTGIPAIGDVFGLASVVIIDLATSQKELALVRKKIR